MLGTAIVEVEARKQISRKTRHGTQTLHVDSSLPRNGNVKLENGELPHEGSSRRDNLRCRPTGVRYGRVHGRQVTLHVDSPLSMLWMYHRS